MSPRPKRSAAPRTLHVVDHPIKKTRVKKLQKSPSFPSNLLSEISSDALPGLKSASFPKSAAAKALQVSAAVSSRVLGHVVADKNRIGVNAEIQKRGVEVEIRQLGARPIALIATSIIHKGLNLKTLVKSTSAVFQDNGRNPSRIAEEVSKHVKINGGVAAKPSKVKLAADHFLAKSAVNTELVKRVVVQQVKKSVKRAGSPVRR